jgi:hypothetical protein
MLSPKATNRVAKSRGGAFTLTRKVHELVRFTESVAVQVTVVSPTGNEEPLSGEQVAVTGGVPFSVEALPYATVSEMPFGATSV